MTMNPLPPQAYTKETLVQAYAWLQNQSENVKEIATTPDVLVSLYLKAKLQGSDFLERPSIQNFKNELKSLAGIMGEFEILEPNSIPNELPAKPISPDAASSGPQINGNQSFRFRSQDMKAQQNAAQSSPSRESEKDPRSEAMIQEVKLQFNLSSEDEAVRLLISTGFHQLKALIK